MDSLVNLKRAAWLKLLGDPTRMQILRLLMGEPASLTSLGAAIGASPARVRHHLKKLEAGGLVRLVSKREVRGFIEKKYLATAKAYQVNLFITPGSETGERLLVTGSDDLALKLLGSSLQKITGVPRLECIPLGSLNGLISVRQGLGDMAGCHLFDPLTEDYNLPYVRALFPDRSVRLFRFVQRIQGLIVAAGNPMKIESLPDIAEAKARFINRNQGSGTRLFVDHLLKKDGIALEAINGYEDEVHTHGQVARAVASGEADVGVGLLAAALEHGLDFVPLQEERFDLLVPEEHYARSELAPLFETMLDSGFRRDAERLGGYRLADAGKEIALNTP